MTQALKKQVERKPLGQILVENGVITQADTEKILKKAALRQQRFGRVLVADGHATEVQLAEALAIQYGYSFENLGNAVSTPEALAFIPGKIARQYSVLPLKVQSGVLIVAVFDPVNVIDLDAVRKFLNRDFQVVVAPESELKRAIEKNYSVKETSLEEIGRQLSKEVIRERMNDLDRGMKAPEAPRNGPSRPAPGLSISPSREATVSVESLVSGLIEEAVARSASDIHIEPMDEFVRVRQRIDGVLRDAGTLPKELHGVVIARLKVLGNIDIAEKRKSQDGSFQHRWGARTVDIRLSTLPIIQGEKAVLRILDKSMLKLSLDSLGLDAALAEELRSLTLKPHGIMLVTGPTGCGKTTTLYSLMGLINNEQKNIISIEDPIEYKIDGINQVQVHAKAGTTFATALRSILRQDPDVIIVGEIRDRETAEIAIRAALTGHLVISTLHTNSAVSTIVRLSDMGVEPFLISSALLGIISQRLVRVLCPHCKIKGPVEEVSKKLLGQTVSIEECYLPDPNGCVHCKGLGFVGRHAIFELLNPGVELRRAIADKKSEDEILAIMKAVGFLSMRDRGIEKVKSGSTTIDEVLKQTI